MIKILFDSTLACTTDPRTLAPLSWGRGDFFLFSLRKIRLSSVPEILWVVLTSRFFLRGNKYFWLLRGNKIQHKLGNMFCTYDEPNKENNIFWGCLVLHCSTALNIAPSRILSFQLRQKYTGPFTSLDNKNNLQNKRRKRKTLTQQQAQQTLEGKRKNYRTDPFPINSPSKFLLQSCPLHLCVKTATRKMKKKNLLPSDAT